MPTTECAQDSLEFESHFSRQVVARFDGGALTSDAGALLLRETGRRIRLIERLAACFDDHRDPALVRHQVQEMVAQRVYALALGYEDLNDHDELRQDSLLALLSGKRDVVEAPLAGKSTLNGIEPGAEQPSRYKKIHCPQESVDALLVEVFPGAHEEAPDCIVLDLDVTDLPLHGHQEGRFFHGYYDEYCYLPLYVFAGEHLLCARLRTADQDAAAGSTEEVKRIVGQIRGRWPGVPIVVRADSGFCREELMAWCEQNRVGCVLGPARNERLRKSIAAQMEEAVRQQAGASVPRVRLPDHDGRGAGAGGLAAGVPVKVVSEMPGRFSVALTLDVHNRVLPHMQEDAVRRMAALLEDSETDQAAKRHIMGAQAVERVTGNVV